MSKPKMSLEAARQLLRQYPDQRELLWDCLVAIEAAIQPTSSENVREVLTGAIVDALLGEDELLSRRTAQGLTVNFRNSSKIGRDFALAREPLPDHVWEPQTTRAITFFATGSRCVVIGGAYFGDQALFAARVMAPGGTCHCFELAEPLLQLLRMNAAENGFANIVINQLALWSSDGAGIALDGEDAYGRPRPATSGSQIAYPSCTIDGYLKSHALNAVDLIMLDIEGGETEALRGAAGLLSLPADRAPAVICEIHSSYVDWSRGLRETELCRLLATHDYHVFALRDYWGNEPLQSEHIELVDLDSTVLEGPPHGFNLLAVKSIDRLASDTFRIVHNVSPKLLKHKDAAVHAPLGPGRAIAVPG